MATDEPVPTDSLVGILRSEIAHTELKKDRIIDFLSQLENYGARYPDSVITPFVSSAITDFTKLAVQCDEAAEKMRELARQLQDKPSDHPEL